MSKNMFDTGKNAIIQHTDSSESMPICFSPIFLLSFVADTTSTFLRFA
ncbi:unknown [Clostridium sp. CAG:349]|nr:unknown [Clostridium sp. CAG:349]